MFLTSWRYGAISPCFQLLWPLPDSGFQGWDYWVWGVSSVFHQTFLFVFVRHQGTKSALHFDMLFRKNALPVCSQNSRIKYGGTQIETKQRGTWRALSVPTSEKAVSISDREKCVFPSCKLNPLQHVILPWPVPHFSTKFHKNQAQKLYRWNPWQKCIS